MASIPKPDHGALMDRIYHGQRHIYDLTRKYYLFGRDRLIRELDCKPGMSVLELGCGTGRNLQLVAKTWPGVRCHGLDISSEMLKSARKRLGNKGALALGDATSFDAGTLFGQEGFDRVMLSYAVSMIPDWQGAVAHAVAALAPGGSLHIVDFGDCAGMPEALRRLLYGWLARFHVSPRLDLPEIVNRLALVHGLRAEMIRGPLGYYQLARLIR